MTRIRKKIFLMFFIGVSGPMRSLSLGRALAPEANHVSHQVDGDHQGEEE
jgi:hypothetical protein